MGTVLLWVGIALTVIGWLASAWQSGKMLSMKDEMSRLPELKKILLLRRSYCRLTIMVGIALVLVALIS